MFQKKRTPWFILTTTSVNMDRFYFFSLLQQEIHDKQKLSYRQNIPEGPFLEPPVLCGI